jgi:drug/metabolite transporter (DMT)-like permease
LILILMGAVWGLSCSLARLATTRGAHPIGLVFWECWIGGSLLLAFLAWRRIRVPATARLVSLHLITGIVGLAIPGAAFFYAAAQVPAGVLSITIGTVPLITFVASALLGLEKFQVVRLIGVALGLIAIVLLVGPQGSLPDPAKLPWLLLGLVAAICYASLSLIVVVMAPRDADPLMLTCGMFIVGALVMVPIVYVTGSFVAFGWPWGAIEWAIVGLGVINGVAYPLYFVLVDRAGPVFTSFTANMVTLFGVVWAILIFAERNSVWVWLSFATIMIALALVAPRRQAPA